MRRREFLGVMAAVPLMAAAASAKPARRLVVVHLFGGNDGLNTIVPRDSAAYQRARPTLGLAASEVVPLRGGLSAHRALAPLLALFEAGRMAVVNGVGMPVADRSHFRTTEIWHRGGLAEDGAGWLARACGPDARTAALDRSCPLALSGATRPLCVDPERNGTIPADLRRGLDDLYASARPDLADAWRRMRDASDRLPQGDVFARASALLRDASVVHVTVSGFDTHSGQRERQAKALSGLAEGLVSLAKAPEDPLVLVFSEFGRRVEENASAGTDHGRAGPVLVVGSAVRGGLYGDLPSLTDLDDGDLRPVLDFRSVYATVLDGWLGVSPTRVLGGRFAAVGLLKGG